AAPLLNVFGGKITTYRRLAETALARLRPWFPSLGPDWTAGAPLPGGDFRPEEAEAICARLRADYPFLDEPRARRLLRAYGRDAFRLLGDARAETDLGARFGAGLTEREVAWLMAEEWALTAEDVLWRRSKLGLRVSAADAARLDAFMAGTAGRAGDLQEDETDKRIDAKP
ncbi:MAG: glycerol-3-phosphate dehydrogenase C-terminal domain-containing protein, partial [Alphaproteobacteria bacterium]